MEHEIHDMECQWSPSMGQGKFALHFAIWNMILILLHISVSSVMCYNLLHVYSSVKIMYRYCQGVVKLPAILVFSVKLLSDMQLCILLVATSC